jgi:endogenous inhibitor of DNA gyrase (YacG/DUF329 family)
MAAKCPTCGKPTDARYRPFCSRRCANVDLQRWLTGAYAIPGAPEGEGDDSAPGGPAASDEAD